MNRLGFASLAALVAGWTSPAGAIAVDETLDAQAARDEALLLSEREPDVHALSGTLMVVTSDFVDRDAKDADAPTTFTHSARTFFLQSKGERIALDLPPELEDVLQDGDAIDVDGVIDLDDEGDATLVVTNIAASNDASDLDVAARAAVPREHGAVNVRKTAIILYNFSDDTSEPVSNDDVQYNFFMAPSSDIAGTNGFYAENTFGSLQFGGAIDPARGDVFGWYTLNQSVGTQAYTPAMGSHGKCGGKPAMDSEAMQRAAADGFDQNNYDHVVFVFPHAVGCNPNLGGFSQVPATIAAQSGPPVYSWIAGNWFGTFHHELGHALGFGHANALHCRTSKGQPVALGAACTHEEYGDPFSIMGASSSLHHTNIVKERLGVFNADQVAEVIPGVQEQAFALSPVEQDTHALKLIKVATGIASRPYFYLERRENGGVYDAFSPTSPVPDGLLVRVSQPGATTYLLDMHPGQDDAYVDRGMADAPLATGERYVDPATGITIKFVHDAAGSGTANVFISLTDPGTCSAQLMASVSQATPLVAVHGRPTLIPVTLTNVNPIGCFASTRFTLASQVQQSANYEVHFCEPANPTRRESCDVEERVTQLVLAPGASRTLMMSLENTPANQAYVHSLLLIGRNAQEILVDHVPASCARGGVAVASLTSLVPATPHNMLVNLALQNQDTATCPGNNNYSYAMTITQSGAGTGGTWWVLDFPPANPTVSVAAGQTAPLPANLLISGVPLHLQGSLNVTLSYQVMLDTGVLHRVKLPTFVLPFSY